MYTTLKIDFTEFCFVENNDDTAEASNFENEFNNALVSSEDSHSDNDAKKKLSRKRQKDPSKWKRNIQKAKRQKGESYVSTSAKENVTNRKDSSGVQLCADSCRFKCNSIDDSDRKKIFYYYYSVNQAMKDSYIYNSMESEAPTRTRLN